jgi:hypothetical protein
MMDENFQLLLPRLIDSNNCVDYDKMIKILKKIKNNCICIGSGGSRAVSQYAQVVLSKKNDVIAIDMETRDVLYTNLERYKHICAFTYGGNNEGVNKALDKAHDYNLNRYILTCDDSKLQNTLALNPQKDFIINYRGHLEKEYSFISIASTLIPMSLLLRYYLGESENTFLKLICDIYLKSNSSIKNDIDYHQLFNDDSIIEIMTGDNTYTASRVIESNLVEAGLNVPIVHEKYNYCHGRSTIAYHHNNGILIYLLNGSKPKEIDITLLTELKDLYKEIIVLKSSQQDHVVGEYDLSLQAMMLSKRIAETLNKDLSKVEYAPVVKKLYKFRGEM